MEGPLDGLCNVLDDYAASIEDEIAIVRELEEEKSSANPEGVMMQCVAGVLESPEFQAMAIRMIADDQMWGEQINMYGQKLPRYKPSTIRKKAKLGFPPDKLVNYTNYWTGRMRNHAIKVAVDLSNNSYDFKVFDVPGKAYSEFIPPDRIGLTDENREMFEWMVMREVQTELDRWMYEQLSMRGIRPEKYGYFNN